MPDDENTFMEALRKLLANNGGAPKEPEPEGPEPKEPEPKEPEPEGTEPKEPEPEGTEPEEPEPEGTEPEGPEPKEPEPEGPEPKEPEPEGTEPEGTEPEGPEPEGPEPEGPEPEGPEPEGPEPEDVVDVSGTPAQLAKRLAEAEAKLAAAQHELLATGIARSVGLPDVLADRLRGTTEEEIRADAEKLLTALDPRRSPLRKSVGGSTTGQPTVTGDLDALAEKLLRR